MSPGRPSIFNDEILAKSREYIDACTDDIEKKLVKIPTIEGLAVYLGISRSTLYEWVSTYPLFSDIIEELKSKQADRLLNNGLAGTYNSTIAKVILTKHGYREGIDTDVTTQGEKINTLDPKALAVAKEYEERLKKGL